MKGIWVERDVGVAERVNAALAAILSVTLVLWTAMWVPWWIPLLALAAVAVGNRRLFGTFRRARGTLFAIAGVAFHQIYYLYGAAIFVACWLFRSRKMRAT